MAKGIAIAINLGKMCIFRNKCYFEAFLIFYTTIHFNLTRILKFTKSIKLKVSKCTHSMLQDFFNTVENVIIGETGVPLASK